MRVPTLKSPAFLSLDHHPIRTFYVVVVTTTLIFSSVYATATDEGIDDRKRLADEAMMRESLERTVEAFKELYPKGFPEGTDDIVIRNGPQTIQNFVPFRFDPFGNLPLELLKHELATANLPLNLDSIFSIFNIQLLSIDQELFLPNNTTLTLSITLGKESSNLNFPMVLTNESTYEFEDSVEDSRSLTNALLEIRSNNLDVPTWVKPEVKLISLAGFSKTIKIESERHFPVGKIINYNFRIGNMRLQTEFQWIGRHEKLLRESEISAFFK